MKKIIYQMSKSEEIFLLTDKEFQEAVACWNTNNEYYCQRLEALLPRKFKFAQTPKNEIGYRVFVYLMKSGGVAKLFQKGGKFYKEIKSDSGNFKVEVNVRNTLKGRLIRQEKYYADK